MASTAPIDIGSFIYSDPGFRDGRPCIAGTGMSVHAVARRFRQGESAEAIAADIPDIPPSHIFAAVAYYLANREQMDAELAAEAAEYDRLYEEWKRARQSHNRTGAC
jgi:uncharacterized protein (DUF433 family)